MYQYKAKLYGIIAVIYYLIYIWGLLLAGILYRNGNKYGMNIVYCLLFGFGILIVLIKDKNIQNLGIEKENLKRNFLISVSIVFVTFLIICIFSNLPFHKLVKQRFYYLFILR